MSQQQEETQATTCPARVLLHVRLATIASSVFTSLRQTVQIIIIDDSYSLSCSQCLLLCHACALLQSHGDAVLGAAFNPGDDNAIVTYGKQHLLFWTLDGNKLSKKSGLFEVHNRDKL